MNSKTLTGIGLALGLAAIQPASAQQSTESVGVPVWYELPTDEPLPQTYRVTLAITDPRNSDWVVSTLVAGEPRTVTAENQGRFTKTWDGLDENFMPVPPGKYGVPL
jgi:flagellar hook assembly protein FlgD